MFNTLLVQPLFNVLVIIVNFVPGHDFGVAIILFTILVRLALWPLVTRQLHSQRALQELQPELAKIREKAKGDRALESQLTMELYKEREINPLASFLPLLIQLPIFLALFVVLKDVIKAGEMAKLAYPAVQNLSYISGVIHGTATFSPTFFGLIDLTKASPLLAAIAALAQFWQTKMLLPKQRAKDQAAQITAGMTYVFPFLTFFIGLSLPSALALYWGTSSAMAIFQQWLVLRQDVEELEAVEIKPQPKRLSKGGK